MTVGSFPNIQHHAAQATFGNARRWGGCTSLGTLSLRQQALVQELEHRPVAEVCHVLLCEVK